MKIFLAFYLVSELFMGSLQPKKKAEEKVRCLQNNEGIELTISNIRRQKGIMLIGLFNSEIGYPDKPLVSYCLAKDTISQGKLKLFIPLKQCGPIGLSILDDENENGRMDYIFKILPKEGYGFSNNPVVKSRNALSFEKTSVMFTGGKLAINIRMVYI